MAAQGILYICPDGVLYKYMYIVLVILSRDFEILIACALYNDNDILYLQVVNYQLTSMC